MTKKNARKKPINGFKIASRVVIVVPNMDKIVDKIFKMIMLLLVIRINTALSDDPCERRDELIDLHIIGFFPCSDRNDTRGIRVDNCDGIDRIPIMKLALEEINERCDLLPGYRLVVDYANSGVSALV